MSKLTRFLGEYFLGTETNKFYKGLECFFKEHYEGNRRGVVIPKFSGLNYFIISKLVPSTIEAYCIGLAISAGEPKLLYWIIPFEEGIRAVTTLIEKKKRLKKIVDLTKKTYDMEDQIRNRIEAIRRINEEGEEWKKGS